MLTGAKKGRSLVPPKSKLKLRLQERLSGVWEPWFSCFSLSKNAKSIASDSVDAALPLLLKRRFLFLTLAMTLSLIHGLSVDFFLCVFIGADLSSMWTSLSWKALVGMFIETSGLDVWQHLFFPVFRPHHVHKAQKQLLTKAAARGTAILLLFSVRAVRELNEGKGTSFKYYDEEDVSPERDVCKWRRFSKIFLDSKTFLRILAPRVTIN